MKGQNIKLLLNFRDIPLKCSKCGTDVYRKVWNLVENYSYSCVKCGNIFTKIEIQNSIARHRVRVMEELRRLESNH